MMKTYEIVLDVEEYIVEQEPFTIMDGIKVVFGFFLFGVPLLFLYFLMCYGG